MGQVTSLQDFARVAQLDNGLCVVSTLRQDGTIQASLVSAGMLDHPLTGQLVIGLVARGKTRKLANLRARPHASVIVHAGFEWVAAEGDAQLAGPDDEQEGIDAERLRVLLRDIFTSAGGTHDDWPTYDRVMAEERRTAVLIPPERVYSNG
jgi:PPOX class probable F420-dependent enzyme